MDDRALKNRVLVGERVSRAAIDAAVRAGETTIESVREALARCDGDVAATRLLARARAGEPVPTAWVGEVLPALEYWPVACMLIAVSAGDRSELLVPLEHRRFAATADASDIEAIALYAAHRGGAPAARVIPVLRRLAARKGSVESYALLARIAIAIDDAHTSAACKPLLPLATEQAASVGETERALAHKLDEVLALLPAEVQDTTGAGLTVRTGKPIGRNEPCPCGSGQKYKKCCADKAVGPASPVAGVSWDDFLTTRAELITPEHVKELPLRDLARAIANGARIMTVPALREAAFRLATHHRRAQLEAIIAELDARPDQAEHADDLREMVAHDLFAGDDHDRELARAYVEKLPAAHRADYRLDLAAARTPGELYAELVGWADAAVTGDGRNAIELAHALLRVAPALGVLVARGCVAAFGPDLDTEVLMESVEEVRDARNLTPSDPAWATFDALADAKREADGESDEGDDELHTSLRESAARADQLERELAAVRSQLAAAQVPVIAELARRDTSAGDDRGSLERKVSELESLIREGNAERRELRKQLTAVDGAAARPRSQAPAAATSPAATPADPDADVGDAVPVMARPVAIPRFEKRAIAAFDDVPVAVAAEAMKTLGQLAAGDFAAWRGVKQAKDMPTTVLMARVGIHHRLILRSDGGSLDVLDLVTRETLMTTLKRLRANL